MKTTHTKGPYHVGMSPGPIIYGPKGEQIADCRSVSSEDAENKANALFITRAINTHRELLEALEFCVDSLEYAADALNPPDGSLFRERIADAKQRIAKAKGAL